MRRSTRAGLGALVAAVTLAGLTGCAELSTSAASAESLPAATSEAAASSGGASSATTTSPEAPPSTSARGTALAALEGLGVKGRAPKTGYARDLFGSGWGDPDRNGCDTRNDVLARDLTAETFKPGTRDCVVATGTLADPYSGTADRLRPRPVRFRLGGHRPQRLRHPQRHSRAGPDVGCLQARHTGLRRAVRQPRGPLQRRHDSLPSG